MSSCPMAPAAPHATEITKPGQPSHQLWPKINQSRLKRPAPIVATATALSARTRLYSQPSFTMKKPLGRCTVHAATSISATKPAAGMGVSSPGAGPRAAAAVGVPPDPRVQHARFPPDAFDPPGGARDPPAAEELVEAVRRQ